MSNSENKRRINTCLVVTSIILICVAVVCLILFFTQGKTTVTGGYDGTAVQERLICESHITGYPLFTYDNSSSKVMKVTGTFQDDKLQSIALTYKLSYDSSDEIKKSESVNHGALGTLMQDEGLGVDAFQATYSKLKDGLQLSLYASGSEINDKALKYFMLEDLTSGSYSKDRITKIYASKGLDCQKNE